MRCKEHFQGDRCRKEAQKAALEARIGALSAGDAKSLEACAKYLRGEKLA